MIKIVVFIVLILYGTAFFINYSFAENVNIIDTFHFRDIRGPNTVNYSVGDRLVFGANIAPPEGTVAQAIQGGANYDLYWNPSPLFPNEFSRVVSFNPALTDIWLITATNETDQDNAETHAVGNVGPLPFVRNTRIEGTGLTPTIRWDLPGDSTEPFTNNSVDIFDDILNQMIHRSGALDISTRSYTVPDNVLEWNGRYVFRVKLGYRLDGNYINQSSTFVNFGPIPGGGPAEVYLPVVDGGVFKFDCDVSEGESVFIDPILAVGYEYEIGPGNPNFASVTLPEAGDNSYSLSYMIGDTIVEESVNAGDQYLFPEGGIDRFTVIDIEPSAELDPNNVTAFITELTFTDDGEFTGTMTPLTEYYCDGDLDYDEDVDGADLGEYAKDLTIVNLQEFAENFGESNCN
jgi:hypothetical protein